MHHGMTTCMIDRTPEFRRLVGPVGAPPATRRIDAFTEDAKALLQSLTGIEELIRVIRPRYERPEFFVTRHKSGSSMSAREKDEFDAEIMELVKNCGIKIDALQEQTLRASQERLEHEKEVVTYLLERLKDVANAAKRLQKKRCELPFLLTHRLLPEDARLRLADEEEAILKMIADKKAREAQTKRTTKSSSALPPQTDPVIPGPSSAPKAESPAAASSAPLAKSQQLQPQPRPISQPPTFLSQSEEIEFTEEQESRFHAENITLHRHFQENLEDAKQMESKMAEISNLMGQFADKIMEQQTEIEMIHQHAQTTSTNIKQSNKILEQTQNIRRGYGFMIFCFYLAFSVLLHLVHYFNN